MSSWKKSLTVINLIILLGILSMMFFIYIELAELNGHVEQYISKFDSLSNYMKNNE